MNNTVPPRPTREEIAAAKKSMGSSDWYDYQADLQVNDIKRLAQKHDIPLESAHRVIRDMDRQFC